MKQDVCGNLINAPGALVERLQRYQIFVVTDL